MICLSWNCRELGNPRTVQDLCLLVKVNKPDVVFLMEVMIKAGRVEALKRRLELDNCLVVEPIGKRGGLALFWGRGVQLEILNFSQWHISSKIRKEGGKKEWFFTGFYGHPDSSKRNLSWELLASLVPKKGEAWCVARDFNEILLQSEKVGGKLRDEKSMGQFREVLEEKQLTDLGCWGCPFTWSNKHEDHTFTKERLDRFLGNHEWRNIFKKVKVVGLTALFSDHKPILMIAFDSSHTFVKRSRRFNFEASWVKNEERER
ncbi:uncharacterized protein LOC122297082 [Carya illinoinensis]|uniref:uncharacterized protein LOC122297082 n=1 Tax=Carya illinoinensis TaxID=32201 RepID=UPI001C725247|nr:uncharacterized protein LOC122297082 [Carya illinoinensis]